MSKIPRLLAIDFGQHTGWCMSHPIKKCGVTKLPDEGREDAYIALLCKLIKEAKPSAVIFENVTSIYQHGKGAFSAHWWGYYHHEMQRICRRLGIETVGVGTTEHKFFATGKGRAPKADMIRAATQYGYITKDDNAADAALLLEYALHNNLVQITER